MAKTKVLSLSGESKKDITLNDEIWNIEINEVVLTDAIKLQMASLRQGTHKTKDRSEVSGGGRKPWRQKGTGRARQGSIRAVQWVGGGRYGTPVPRDYSKKQNRRLIIGAIFALLGIVIVLSCAVLGYFFSTAPTHGTDIPEELCQRIVDFSRNLFLQIVGIEISKFVILLINLIILVIILIQALKIDKKQGIIFFIGLTFYLFVQIFLFGIFISQRTVLIFIFLLYFSWNTKKNCMKKNKIDVLEIIIFFICLLSIPNSVRLVSDEIKYPYSDSKNTAKYIEENIDPENSVILTVNWDTISAVEVYLSGKNYKFYDATGKEYMTFATWNKFLDSKKEMYLEDALKEFENSDKKLYLLNFISDGYKIEAWKYFNKSKDKLKPIYITKEKCITRKAYLYKIEN